jgi:hypothetical protein
MAIDITTDPQPAFGAQTGVTTACTQIRGPAFSSVVIIATGAAYIYNGVPEGGTVAGATARVPLTADQMAAGVIMTLGGAVRGADYGTVCISAQTGTIDVSAYTSPPERVAP